MTDEQKHFEECRDIINQNISYFQARAEKGRKETESLFAAVAAGNVELYNQLIVSQDIEEHQERQLRKNQAAWIKPYFGRIDYQEKETGQLEQLYIGKNGISKDRTDVLIVDWRAPVAALYYENELGAGSYDVPEAGKIDVDLCLKRTFDVDNGRLLGYYDNDTAATDELLVKYLSQNKDVVLGDIISTIQKEQNEIIRRSPFGNIIVQGVAGSGKTTVAMHRISYILYNYEQRFSPEEFCIIGNNDMLLNYITSGLPELDVYHVGRKRMDTFFRDLLGKEWKKKYRLGGHFESEAYKSRMDFITGLDRYLSRIREHLLKDIQVADSALGVILSSDSIGRTVMENPDASVAKLFQLLNQRIKTRIHFLMSEDSAERCKEKTAEYKGYFQLNVKHKNIAGMYLEFLEEYGENRGIPVEQTVSNVKNGLFDVYDLAALVLIQKRMVEKAFHDEYSQIIIDEAQDFGPSVYYVLKQVLFQCWFTIMGDVSQNIYYHTGMNDWNDLTEMVFDPERTGFHILAKSYRNTIEISEVAGRVLEAASFGRYKIQPVIRHGMPVAYYHLTEEEMAVKAAEVIAQIRGRGYDTIAVICRSQEEASRVQEKLRQFPGIFEESSQGAGAGKEAGEDPQTEKTDRTAKDDITPDHFTQGVMVLPIHLTKGLEFDSVLLWNPDQYAYPDQEGDAKLLYVAITRALHELHILCCGALTGLLKGQLVTGKTPEGK